MEKLWWWGKGLSLPMWWASVGDKVKKVQERNCTEILQDEHRCVGKRIRHCCGRLATGRGAWRTICHRGSPVRHPLSLVTVCWAGRGTGLLQATHRAEVTRGALFPPDCLPLHRESRCLSSHHTLLTDSTYITHTLSITPHTKPVTDSSITEGDRMKK